MKQRVDRLLDYFSDKTLSFGCEVVGVDLAGFSSPRENEDVPLKECNWDSEREIICKIDDRCIISKSGLPVCIHWLDIDRDATVIIKVIGHPVTKGHVEKKIKELQIAANGSRGDTPINDLNTLNKYWLPFDPTKPLNEIFSGEIETMEGGECDMCGADGCEMYSHEDWERFKDPNTQALFEFLESIVPEDFKPL